MVKTGPSKPVDRIQASGRLRKALSYHTAARLLQENVSALVDPDPIVSNAALSAIAYVDALTVALGGKINQKDHGAAIKLLRSVMGNSLPNAQEKNLNKLLGAKDEVQYGSRPGKTVDAESLLICLDRFGDWVKAVLTENSMTIVTIDGSKVDEGSHS